MLNSWTSICQILETQKIVGKDKDSWAEQDVSEWFMEAERMDEQLVGSFIEWLWSEKSKAERKSMRGLEGQ